MSEIRNKDRYPDIIDMLETKLPANATKEQQDKRIKQLVSINQLLSFIVAEKFSRSMGLCCTVVGLGWRDLPTIQVAIAFWIAALLFSCLAERLAIKIRRTYGEKA